MDQVRGMPFKGLLRQPRQAESINSQCSWRDGFVDVCIVAARTRCGHYDLPGCNRMQVISLGAPTRMGGPQ